MARRARQRRRGAARLPPPRPDERTGGAGQVPGGSGKTGGLDMSAALYESSIESLPLLGRGKVRDMYAVGRDHLLIVTTDRLSAFDVVLPDPIPDKGRVLNELSNFWFGKTGHIIPNHLTGAPLSSVVRDPAELAMLEGRAVIVKRLQALPLEAVVRGYLIGSACRRLTITARP